MSKLVLNAVFPKKFFLFEAISSNYFILIDPLNPYFCNSLDGDILESDKTLWIHGHVHSRWDYMIGNCRVVANPLGYPREIPGEYEIKIVEI